MTGHGRITRACALIAVSVSLIAANGCAPPGTVAQLGSTGVTVQRIQRALNLPVDGVYGAATVAAVGKWQTAHRLNHTGAVDQPTMNGLFPFRVTNRAIGASVRGRAITMQIIGDPNAARRVAVLGCIHGNECAGVPVLTALSAVAPAPNVAYYLIGYPNPDGTAAHTRQNAQRVDLNRNFPGWQAAGSPGYVYYPGPRALSEPESRTLYNLINSVKPTVLLTYHQAMNIVDYNGGNKAAGLRYAQISGEPYTQTTRYPGSAATWANNAYPSMTVLTVELPASVDAARITANFRAAQWVAANS